MEKNKEYKEQLDDSSVVSEPALGYHALENVATYLPEDILAAAVKYADISRQRGEMIPHDKVYSILSHRLGWK